MHHDFKIVKQKDTVMKKMLLIPFLTTLLLLNAFVSVSQEATLVPLIASDNSIVRSVSSNGLWATGYYNSDGFDFGATLWNLSTYEEIKLSDPNMPSAANAVTNDGQIVVGSYNDMPAYWQDGVWTFLPLPIEEGIGEVTTVTPDGSIMAGRVFTPSMGEAYACLWENGELVDLNLPDKDRLGGNAYFNEINAVSDDGNTILGCLNYNILPDRTAFIIRDGEYRMFGAEHYDPQTGGDEYNFYDVLSMSKDGNWVTGDIYWVEEMWTSEYFCPFRYDVVNDEVELFLNDAEVASFAVDNDGNLYGATPLNYPLRSALVLRNGQWVSFEQIIMLEYGIDVFEATGYNELSNIFCVSADGKTVAGTDGIVKYNWVLKTDVTTGIDNQVLSNPMQAVVKGNKLVLGGKVKTLTVCDLQGKTVMSHEVNGMPIFDISHLPASIYIVNMSDASQHTVSTKVYMGR